MKRLHSIVGILLFTAVTQAALAQENEKRKTVLDGVFTTAQAERGKEAYATHCSTCHMEDLGGLSAPALKGEQFIEFLDGTVVVFIMPRVLPKSGQFGKTNWDAVISSLR